MTINRDPSQLSKDFQQPSSDQAGGQQDSQPRPGALSWALMVLIFVVGLAVRLYDFADPPLDFHPTRQLHSALIARGMYYQQHGGVPVWQQEMAIKQWRMEGIIEPQVFERLAAWSYTFTGGPDLRVPRLYAVLFWMAAAVFLALLAFELVGWVGAVVSTAFFLTWPYGVIASRSFQPEPLMIALTAAALWAAVRWERDRRWLWVILAGLLAGLAVYIKTVAVFFIAPALVVLVLPRFGLGAVKNRQVWVMAGLAVLPTLAYYIDGVLLGDYLASQFGSRFFPHMWIDPAFYLRWISNLSRMLPFVMVLVSLGGVLLLRRSTHRGLLFALWAGYLLYGLTLPHHISTHDYYHLPLSLPIAIGIGAVAQSLYRNFRGPGWLVRAAASGLLIAALLLNAYDARTMMKRFDAAARADAWAQIGAQLGPNASVAALVPDYGTALQYYGWINPILWPSLADIGDRSMQSIFADQAASRAYFLVTSLDEFERQPELKGMLYQSYNILSESPDYLIFDLRVPIQR
jgi:4-amino-4-deoxy-L-arabinose transferase-like glycosyltransferase